MDKFKNSTLKKLILLGLGILILVTVIVPLVQTYIFWLPDLLPKLERDRMTGWNVYRVDNSGLTSYQTNAITFDDLGRAWIGTDEGVSVFDGKNWQTFTAENSGISTGAVQEIEIDHLGKMWIITNEGVSVFDGKTWVSYTTTENSDILGDSVWDIAFDDLGRTWIGTTEGLSVYYEDTWVSYTIENSGISGNFIRDIEIDDLGRAWIGTNEGVNVFDGETWVSYTTENSGFPGNIIRDIKFDNVGNVWFGTDEGVSVFDGETWHYFTADNSSILEESVNAIEFDNLGNIWIRTAHDVSAFDGDTWTTHQFADWRSQLLSARGRIVGVNALVTDYFGHMFVLTDDSLRILTDDGWLTYDSETSGYSTAYSTDIAFDPEGNIWITGDLGVSVATVDAFGLPQSFSPEKITHFENSFLDWRNSFALAISLMLLWLWFAIYMENTVILIFSIIVGLSFFTIHPGDPGIFPGVNYLISTQVGGILGGIAGSVVRKRRKMVSIKTTTIGFLGGAFIGLVGFFLFVMIAFMLY